MPKLSSSKENIKVISKKNTGKNKPETITKVKRKRKLKESEATMGCLSSKKLKTESKDDVSAGNLTKQNVNTQLLTDDWNHINYVSHSTNISESVTKVILQYFDNDNTIPFIARYRKNQIGGLDADKLREVKESYDKSKTIKHKAETIIKAIEKSGKGSSEIYNAIKSAKTLNELEDIYALYRTGSKRNLADKARELGLGGVAEAVLRGDKIPHLRSLIDSGREGLESEDEIKDGIICIIADIICKDNKTFEKIKELRQKIPIQLETKKSVKANTTENPAKKKKNDDNKYEMYYNWTNTNKNIYPYQILAINRAEKEKVISLQVTVPDSFEITLKKFILNIFKAGTNASPFHNILINNGFRLAYKKSIKPAIIRRTRSEMNERAEEASTEVFAKNVKQLLLTQPVRGKKILGIDPGFAHGCKIAVISEQGDVLDTATIYPHKEKGQIFRDWKNEATEVLSGLIHRHKISTIALGNATACRETEEFLSNLINSRAFGDENILYAIVNEAGASTYSCTTEAKCEFPKLDYNIISAISIARRLQDPLAELVKVEPKHLGVGMYQHDMPEKQLICKLNEVVIEVVSFVGVDVNTASQSLLKRVAGLSETKATNIIEWRKKNGPFINRKQLLKVKNIGSKTFEQCAGFIRILPETAKSTKQSKDSRKINFNYLDQTWIHPESYNIANAFIRAAKVNIADLGTRNFISAVNVFIANKGFDKLTELFNTNATTLEIIYKGLTMSKGEDIRFQYKAPLFRKSLRSINDLSVESVLSGEVRNITDFGVFIDIGVEKDGLVHWKNSEGKLLVLGQRVNVKVNSIDKDRYRIGLVLV
ncbi:S1 RNA-binding domain-containing protein 1 [Chelonus insularis]|uniref:S1 RNA-binding domain-containing protein 1 n=1 Tax=Chelonus insularis TaxID=460826 RepID=UPI00158E486D|nr:S1 RNA-binding domain-containing protein 1 [Chelonus insularis]XP_034946011.1 S1 RNA-binding domain-containing protein 1 [Chelonus insularis]XP_034946012.1 S1 RNA-binding domain-containing protein 1 [Chelonus insularis]XP_034946013.1 S1 RNA-binding domain-containing protein 1 [Chelonus insularis]